MNIAVVGTNFISDRFVEAAALCKNAKITAVYSRKHDTGMAFADKYGIKTVYTDYLDMLSDENIGGVYIASPTFCHAAQAVRAMRAGKHVLCEKMMGADLADCLWMERVREECGVVLLEAMRPAHDPAIEVIRSALPRLGKIRRASLEFCQYSSRYDAFLSGEVLNAFDPKIKNSALADIGIYPLHMAVNLFGEPKSVQASSIFLSNGFEGEGILTLGYGDMIATVVYSKITSGVNPSVIEGERGSLIIDKISAPSDITLHLRGEAPARLDYTAVQNNMVYEIEAFCDMAEGRSDCMPYLAITEKAHRIVEEAYKLSGASAFMQT